MENVISHVVSNTKEEKKKKGQFYTINSDYILDGFELNKCSYKKIIEPFVGKGDLVKWLKKKDCDVVVEMYDIDPKYEGSIKQDTLKDIPDYSNSFILTNPPYLARNKSTDKTIFDKYETNDLYKCFLLSLCNSEIEKRCNGGIIIIPAGFFFSPRKIDYECRNKFLSMFKIEKVKYFEEQVFHDTPTTVIAIQFKKSDTLLESQEILWNFLPSDSNKIFELKRENDWIIGGEIYNLPTNKHIKIDRYIPGLNKAGQNETFLTLQALDSGKADGRICLKYKKDYLYKGKLSSRSYATLLFRGIKLNEIQQIQLSELFNEFIEKKREEYDSLFLPQYRESKEYARKRIPFELAYDIINYLISYKMNLIEIG